LGTTTYEDFFVGVLVEDLGHQVAERAETGLRVLQELRLVLIDTDVLL